MYNVATCTSQDNWKCFSKSLALIVNKRWFLTHNFADPWLCIHIRLEQRYGQVSGSTDDISMKAVEGESMKQPSATLLNTMDQAQRWQHPCIKTRHIKKLWIATDFGSLLVQDYALITTLATPKFYDKPMQFSKKKKIVQSFSVK